MLGFIRATQLNKGTHSVPLVASGMNHPEAVLAVSGGQFGQFDQDVAGRGRVEEGDAAAAMAAPWRLVQQLHAFFVQLHQRGIDILDLETQVKQTLSPLGDPLRYRRDASSVCSSSSDVSPTGYMASLVVPMVSS